MSMLVPSLLLGFPAMFTAPVCDLHRAGQDAFGSQPHSPAMGAGKVRGGAPGALLKARRNGGWGCPWTWAWTWLSGESRKQQHP